MNDLLRHRLGVYLWRSSLTEQIATSVFRKLTRWEFLDAVERHRAEEFSEQEATHSRLLRALARDIYPERPDAHLRALYVPEHVWQAFAGVVQAERISLPGFEHMRALGERLGHEGIVEAYDVILQDEPRHLRWGLTLLRRMRSEPRYHADVLAYLKTHPIATEYRQVAQERPWTLA